MKYLHIIITVLFLGLSNLTHSQMKTYLSNAVNVAGKQRMLGQRMAKNKIFIKANKKTSIASKELEKTILAFEKGLKVLKDFAPSPAIRHKVEIQEYTFKTYKKNILDRSNESLKDIINTNTLFLAICDDVVTELINYSKTLPKNELNKHQTYVIDKIAEATGASGKLRYLTQRLTLYFSMDEFGFKDISPKQLDEIIKTMDKNLNYLTVLEFNTIDIDDSLSQVHYYWSQLKKKLYLNGKINMETKKINASLLYGICNTILDKANTTTKMYADLNKQ